MSALGKHKGAMHSLMHEKANALFAVKELAEQALELLKKDVQDETLNDVLAILDQRLIKTREIQTIDQRFGFLRSSGYVPEPPEAVHVATERETVETLLLQIREIDEESSQTLLKAQGHVAESLKGVRDGQRSIQAYAGPPEEVEGANVDALR